MLPLISRLDSTNCVCSAVSGPVDDERGVAFFEFSPGLPPRDPVGDDAACVYGNLSTLIFLAKPHSPVCDVHTSKFDKNRKREALDKLIIHITKRPSCYSCHPVFFLFITLARPKLFKIWGETLFALINRKESWKTGNSSLFRNKYNMLPLFCFSVS